jgi:hypothetical protein
MRAALIAGNISPVLLLVFVGRRVGNENLAENDYHSLNLALMSQAEGRCDIDAFRGVGKTGERSCGLKALRSGSRCRTCLIAPVRLKFSRRYHVPE